jgi:cell division protein FtsB
MSDPHAREPLDATPSPATPTPPAPVAAPDEEPAGRSGDLAAVPAFLRSRLAATTSPTSPGPVRRPEPVPVPDLAALPMFGIAPRRLILAGAAILLAWTVVSFGRQVAEASASSARAEDLRAANAALTDEVAAMEQELQVIQDQRYIGQAARAFRLGNPDEIPFALEADAPPLPADAPGSAAARLGADDVPDGPLERWLDVLFGPGG